MPRPYRQDSLESCKPLRDQAGADHLTLVALAAGTVAVIALLLTVALLLHSFNY